MKRVYYNKLIRDLIPKKIEAKGSRLKTRKLGSREFNRELLKKLSEEAAGALNAKSREEMTGELADIQDVIDELKKTHRIDKKTFETALRKNRRSKGGFKKRLFLIWSSDDGYKTNEKRR